MFLIDNSFFIKKIRKVDIVSIIAKYKMSFLQKSEGDRRMDFYLLN